MERDRSRHKAKRVTFDDDVSLDIVEDGKHRSAVSKSMIEAEDSKETREKVGKVKATEENKLKVKGGKVIVAKGDKEKVRKVKGGKENEGKVRVERERGGRSWDDLKGAGEEEIEKGPFKEDELKKLQESIVEYCLMNNLNEEQLVELITSSSSEKYKNAWIEIAGVLPNRKVQSCHAVCKRKFNPNNYRGRWSDEEVDFLLDYVENKGRDWEKIGKLIGRTALNVRDKFKELGEGNFANRTKSK